MYACAYEGSRFIMNGALMQACKHVRHRGWYTGVRSCVRVRACAFVRAMASDGQAMRDYVTGVSNTPFALHMVPMAIR